MTICVYSHLVAVFVVQEIGVLIKSGRGHHKLSFDTPRIEIWSLTTEKISIQVDESNLKSLNLLPKVEVKMLKDPL